MEKFTVIDNRDEWNKILQNFENIDCYYSFEYGNLFAKIENGQLLAAYFESKETRVFYPFIKRKVPNMDKDTFDIVTPYGYGGPLVEGTWNPISNFYETFSLYCSINNIITETIRFHPLYRNHLLFKGILDVEYIRQTTAVDLTPPIDTIKNNYSLMNRRNIKKAKKNKLTCFIADKSAENIKVFMELYKETMDRNHAASYYYFDESYFLEQVNETEISNTYLLFTEMNNEVIAGVLVFVGQEFSHYHLGASKTKYLDVKPNNLLFDFMIEFCKSKGVKALHLGGGYQENDGLFKFKTSFSNNNNYEYYIGKKVHDLKRYNEIIENLSEQYEINDSYFPIYRAHLSRRIFQT